MAIKIVVGEHEIPVKAVHEERTLVVPDGMMPEFGDDRPIRRIVLDGGITDAEIEAMQQGTWSEVHDDGTVIEHKSFNDLLTHEITFMGEDRAGLDPEIEAVIEENQRFAEHIPSLLIGKPAGVALLFWQYFPPWAPRKWEAGENCLYQGHPYSVIAPGHDSTGMPNWNPIDAPSLFKVWHGVSYDTALPYKAPTGAHDIYKAGEYMIWTDGNVMRASRDTAYSPIEYPTAWESGEPA